MHRWTNVTWCARSSANALHLLLTIVLAAGVSLAASAAQAGDDSGRMAPHFVLTASDGRTVSDDDFLGQHLLVFFGYTGCPDLCPTGLQVMARVMDLLGPLSAKVQPLFVTLDPDRDTRDVISTYVANFHPRLLGLTGSQDMIASVAKGFRVKYAKTALPEGGYAIDHTAAIFHVGPDGTILDRYPQGFAAEEIAAQLQSAFSREDD